MADHPDKFVAFKNLVKTGRMVEWWKATDELAQKVTVALYKQITCNDGTAKATDVSVTVEFPKEILAFDIDDVNDIKEPKAPEKPQDLQEVVYEKAQKSEVALKNLYSQLEFMNAYSSAIWPTITPTISRVDFGESIDISDNVVELELKGIVHTKFGWFSGIRIVPMVKGTFKAKVILMCVEYEKPDETEITFVCE